MSTQETIEAFALLVDGAGRAVRLLEQAEKLPQAHLPEARETIEQIRLERAAALADVCAFALRHADALVPSLFAPNQLTQSGPRLEHAEARSNLSARDPYGVVSYTRTPELEAAPEANPFLAMLGPVVHR